MSPGDGAPPAALAPAVFEGFARLAPARLRLRDGSVALVRPLGPADAARLAEGHARLSPRSRYRRFLEHRAALSPEALRYLTDVDQRDHVAWLAVDPDAPGEPMLGVARAIRLAEDPALAEVAVTVVDDQQGKGLGTLLLGVLSACVAARGVTTYRALVTRENAPMLELFAQLGGRVTASEDEASVWLDVPVPRDPARLPDTPAGRAIAALARGDLVARPVRAGG